MNRRNLLKLRKQLNDNAGVIEKALQSKNVMGELQHTYFNVSPISTDFNGMIHFKSFYEWSNIIGTFYWDVIFTPPSSKVSCKLIGVL